MIGTFIQRMLSQDNIIIVMAISVLSNEKYSWSKSSILKMQRKCCLVWLCHYGVKNIMQYADLM